MPKITDGLTLENGEKDKYRAVQDIEYDCCPDNHTHMRGGKDAFEEEENWGNTHALRRLLTETEGTAKVVAESGAVDYCVRLLEGGDTNAHVSDNLSNIPILV